MTEAPAGGHRKAAPATRSRELILDILLEVLEKDAFVHDVLRQALEKYQYLPKSDRALITRIAEGTVEYRLTIDEVLNRCSSHPVEKMKPVIREILRMSVYQLLWMDRVPDSAVCSEAVKLAQSRRFGGLKGFVNGVLRTVARQKEQFVFEDRSLRYSMPSWLIRMWDEQYPPETVEGLLAAFLSERPVTVRCSRSRASVGEVRESLRSQGVESRVSPLYGDSLELWGLDHLEGLTAFRQGWIQIQDAASSLAGAAAAPCPGDRVLDVCGAPGGKGLHIADLLGGTGQVVIRDLTEEKVRLIRENIARSGCANCKAQIWDALCFDPAWEERADIVIADLPCSGLGVIGRKPDIKYRITEERIGALAELQRQILSVAARYVRPGGKLIYSTCTISRRENEDQRQWFLENFPFGSASLAHLAGEALSEDTLEDGYVQLLPGKHPCDGFFIASFRRKDQENTK